MSNILNSGAQNANQATAPTPRVNDVPVGLSDGRNRFDMSFDNYLTARYGTILPFHFFQAYERDKVSFSSRHEVRSYTMSAPWMGSAYLHKHYFAVPMPALLRRNWQKIQVQPLKGDDAPQDANCVIIETSAKDDIISRMLASFNSFPSGLDDGQALSLVFRRYFLLEYFLSPASLVSLTGNCFYGNLSDPALFDTLSQSFFDSINTIVSGADSYFRISDSDGNVWQLGKAALPVNARRVASLSDFLDIWRGDLSISAESFSFDAAPIKVSFSQLVVKLASAYTAVAKSRFNYQYALAYQCVCAQFYTNDHVDNLYTWELYEQAAQSILCDVLSTVPTFQYNGVSTMYDIFSGCCVKRVIDFVSQTLTAANHNRFISACVYLQYLFGIHNSLVYGDYFHAAKTTPLAAVDVNSPVTDSKVSAINVTKSIVMQRFGNAVQKAGQRFKDYVGDILGGNVSPDYHEPKWIVGNTFLLGANEIENTANDQGNVVQNIRTSADNWVYETEFGMQSVVLGLFFFNSPSVYSLATFRENFQVDRFDFFNPRLQNIGDQPVLQCELHHSPTFSGVFGYQTRNADMKQRFSIARGGFIGSLPAWSFVIDEDNPFISTINSDYIRDFSGSFDRFYSRLTGFTLANRFHMIFKFSNECHASRNMQITPTIL